ncbi:hypothetical protein ASC97_28980 [Rhizobium sp. Root1203]|uniref:hypothetical protein n=1 Tax=Rhizobium sp. Root1203 TaxID=1736427 RepID=UPI00070B733D|nr:hypothetical protein [Rhizobium sp. Root1203]KQV19706.1 hypothetical protein ASC97_28980 [Rhizobium sp. Root1203]
MITFPTVIACLLGIVVFILTATSTGRRRKRGRMGPRAFQARMAAPIFLSVLGILALTITKVEFLEDVGGTFIVLLILFAVFSSFTVPLVLFFWLVIFAVAQWTNVFALIVILSMGVAIGHTTGFLLGSRRIDDE